MSPNVGNFVHDLVEMAKAMETLPQVQDELDSTKAQLETTRQAVQDRELAIIHYKSEIDDLHAKVRSLEVERDDASFRVLEAEDVIHAALSEARVTKTSLELIIAKLDPPKPEPVKEPEPFTPLANTPAQGQSVENPSASNPVGDGNHIGDASTMIVEKQSDAALSPTSELLGQSESSPTVLTGPTASDAHSEHVSSGVAGTTTTETSLAEPTHGPYFGKRYVNVDGFISRYDWLNNGGTEEDYDWRPAPSPRY